MLIWPAPQGQQVHSAPPDVAGSACVHEEKHWRGGRALPTPCPLRRVPLDTQGPLGGAAPSPVDTPILWVGPGWTRVPQPPLNASSPRSMASGWEVSALPPAGGGLLALGHLHPRSPPTAGQGLHCQLFHWAQPVRGIISLQQRISL